MFEAGAGKKQQHWLLSRSYKTEKHYANNLEGAPVVNIDQIEHEENHQEEKNG